MRILAFVLALTLASPAFALLAPQYYQQARDTASDVVVIAVRKVDTPPLWVGHGTCVVRGRVETVERGARYAPGADVAIDVPCLRHARGIPAGPVMWKSIDGLRHAPRGRAFLTGAGGLALYQYDPLN